MSEEAREPNQLALWAPDLEEAERARRMIATYKLISKLDTEMDRRQYDLFNLRLYSRNNDQLLYDATSEDFIESSRFLVAPTENSKNNRAKAAIDTLASQVASTDTRARCEVINGDYKIRRRGRLFQDFTDGLAEDLKLQRLKRRAWMDASIFESGRGVVQLYRKGQRCAARRVLPTELAIDPHDGRIDGEVRTIYWARPIPRTQAHSEFGTKANKNAIDNASPVPSDGTPIDEIMVYESWTLPTAPDAGDGWHIVALDTEDGDIVVKPYKKDHHELVMFAIEERSTGAWGNSLMSQVRDLQIRINANDFRIERSTRVFHAMHLYVDKSNGINKSKLTNELGTVWEGNGPTPPQQIKFDCARPELYEQVQKDGDRIFEDLGVNLQASQGSSDTGLESSGEARREAKKSLDGRNSLRQQRYEEFHLDLVRAAVSIVRDIVNEQNEAPKPKKGAKADKRPGKASYTVEAKGQDGLTKLDFNDIAIDEDNYKLTVKPASPVPTDPAGLKAHGQEMLDLGLWTPDVLAEYWQDLDSEGRTNTTVSKRRNLRKKFDLCLYEGEALAMPDEFTDFTMAMQVGLEMLNIGEEEGVPPKNLERLRRYLRQVKRLDTATKGAGAAPPAPGNTGQPPANPAPAPPT